MNPNTENLDLTRQARRTRVLFWFGRLIIAFAVVLVVIGDAVRSVAPRTLLFDLSCLILMMFTMSVSSDTTPSRLLYLMPALYYIQRIFGEALCSLDFGWDPSFMSALMTSARKFFLPIERIPPPSDGEFWEALVVLLISSIHYAPILFLYFVFRLRRCAFTGDGASVLSMEQLHRNGSLGLMWWGRIGIRFNSSGILLFLAGSVWLAISVWYTYEAFTLLDGCVDHWLEHIPIVDDIYGHPLTKIGLICLFIILVDLLPTHQLLYAGRRRLILNAQTVLLRDKRPPVLLLRSFRDDKALLKPTSFLAKIQRRRMRLEEAIASTLERVGVFIAVGSPKERLPPLGAHRAYLGANAWQKQVLQWFETSRVIVMIAGVSEWVSWELREICRAGKQHRLLLLLPPGDAVDRAARWQHVRSCFEGSPWQAALDAADAKDALLVYFKSDQTLGIIVGRKRQQLDYGLALAVALYHRGKCEVSKQHLDTQSTVSVGMESPAPTTMINRK